MHGAAEAGLVYVARMDRPKQDEEIQMSTTVTLTMEITPELADRLVGMRCHNFVPEQPDRFEPAEADNDPSAAEFSDGVLMWCHTASDAMLRLFYERSCGYKALGLHDVDLALTLTHPGGTHVVLSSRSWSAILAESSPEA